MGLVKALCKLTGHEVLVIEIPGKLSVLLRSLFAKSGSNDYLPDPDILVGAGHSVHFSMIISRLFRGGRTVVLMRPSLPLKLFDLCLIPDHDKTESGENVIATMGPLNPITASREQRSDRGLILVGGPSRHCSWNNDQLMQQLLPLFKQDYIKWTVVSSPRTPAETHHALENLAHSHVEYLPYTKQEVSPVEDLLSSCANVWVTQDSMSMIYESLSCGCAVGVLHVPHHPESKLSSVAGRLSSSGLVTLFADWSKGIALKVPEKPLNESVRCADLLLQRFGWSDDSFCR